MQAPAFWAGRTVPLSNAPRNSTSRADLEEAYQRYRLELRRFFALKSRDADVVDDLIQTMYLRIRNVANAGGPLSDAEVRDPRQYLFRTAWNLLHSENRRVRAEREHVVRYGLDDWAGVADRSNRLWVEDDTDSSVQHAELDRVLGELPRACQVALLRQYRDNRSYKEIAAEMGVTTHAVKKYIMRALNHFRMHFNATDLGLHGREEKDGQERGPR